MNGVMRIVPLLIFIFYARSPAVLNRKSTPRSALPCVWEGCRGFARRGGSSEESDSYLTTTPSAEAAATPPKQGGEFLLPARSISPTLSRPARIDSFHRDRTR